MTILHSRRTPYDHNYGSCEKTFAELRIYPGYLEPSDVSLRLGIEPTSAQKTGEIIITKLGRKRTVKINGWFLSSEGQVFSKDTRHHLDWLLDILEPVSHNLMELQKEPGMSMTINCVWWSNSGNGGPTLWPEQMKRLSELNLECSFDVYLSEDD